MTSRYETSPERNAFELALKSFHVSWIPNNTIPFSLFSKIERYLLRDGDLEDFDITRKVSDGIHHGYILIEYNDLEERSKDIDGNTKLELENSFKSKPLEWDRQIAESVWSFEYNGKYYLIVYPRNRKTDEINSNIGVYKGIIVNHWAYNSSKIWEDEWIKSQVSNTLWETE